MFFEGIHPIVPSPRNSNDSFTKIQAVQELLDAKRVKKLLKFPKRSVNKQWARNMFANARVEEEPT